MAQLVVRNLEDEIKVQLQARAARHGHSMEEEVREILRDAAKSEDRERGGLGSEIAAMFSGQGLGFELPELPLDWTMRIPTFSEDEDDGDHSGL
jgi:plasmid stability protein